MVESNQRSVVCIADGTGGLAGGALAAEWFVDGVRLAAEPPTFEVTSPDAWVNCLETLDRAIELNPRAGETTGIALTITRTAIVGASFGDS